MIDTELRIWAAGMFDGEGSALIERVGYGRKDYQIVVAVAGTDSRAIDPIMEAWGGHHRKTRDLNKWRHEGSLRRLDCSVYFSRDEAKVFLADIFPYLKTKHSEAFVVLRAISAQEAAIKKSGLRGSSSVLESFYEELQSIRSRDRSSLVDTHT